MFINGMTKNINNDYCVRDDEELLWWREKETTGRGISEVNWENIILSTELQTRASLTNYVTILLWWAFTTMIFSINMK